MGKKAREPRQVTCAPARLNSDGRWQDVCIRNISTRGMMVEVQHPPPRGHYLEVRRGAHVIIGRVVWSSGYHVGILSQDKLEIGAIVADLNVPKRRARSTGELVERRNAPRHAERHDRSRLLSRTIEYASMLALGAIGALLAMDVVDTALDRPLRDVQAALSGGGAAAAEH